ncbi:hypothetical protein [Crateriforma conspicua]|uniref:hypothetical protein n=1 Tax=Crateriforma TaxID=2714592 RepID=UPI0018CFE23B|nr:hypothetical protein [Crateriforma conspicua]
MLIVLVCNIVACRTQQSANDDAHPEIFTTDHIQYFPDGPQFKLSHEAAALKAARAEERTNAEPVGNHTSDGSDVTNGEQ